MTFGNQMSSMWVFMTVFLLDFTSGRGCYKDPVRVGFFKIQIQNLKVFNQIFKTKIYFLYQLKSELCVIKHQLF